MTTDREQLINKLATGIQIVEPVNTRRSAIVWFGSSFLFVALLSWLTGPFRAGSGHQLLESIQFLIESSVGLMSIALLIYTAFELSIPSPKSLTKRLFWPLLALAVWIGFYIFGLIHPALEPSMLGKRDFCFYQTALYSLPLMVTALFWAKRQWPLHAASTGLLIGLAAGAIPAWIMQFACMYLPQHILTAHILPGLAMGPIGALLGVLILRRK